MQHNKLILLVSGFVIALLLRAHPQNSKALVLYKPPLLTSKALVLYKPPQAYHCAQLRKELQVKRVFEELVLYKLDRYHTAEFYAMTYWTRHNWELTRSVFKAESRRTQRSLKNVRRDLNQILIEMYKLGGCAELI